MFLGKVVKRMQLNAIAEGLEDYVLDREEHDAREQVIHWAMIVADPCCRDCALIARHSDR